MLKEETLKQVAEVVASAIEKSVPELVRLQLEKSFEEKGLNKIEKKIFGSAKEIEGLEGKEKSARFIKAVYNRDKETARAIVGKAMTESADTAGGHLVPEEFRSEIVRLAEDFGLIRKQARMVPMKREVLKLPKVTASVTVYWPGETNAGTESKPTLGLVTLTAKTLVGLTPVTNELLEDADVDVIDLLVELFAEAIAGEEDKQALRGTGAPFTGVLSVAGVNTVTMGTGETGFEYVNADHLRDLVAGVKTLALSGAGFYMHRSVWGVVQKIKDASGQYLVTAPNPVMTGDASKASGVVGYIWGYPVYLSEKMPSLTETAAETKFVVFGNPKFIYLGDRKQMTIAISEDATIGDTNLFESNMSAVRITERIAMEVALPSAFAVLKTAAA